MTTRLQYPVKFLDHLVRPLYVFEDLTTDDCIIGVVILRDLFEIAKKGMINSGIPAHFFEDWNEITGLVCGVAEKSPVRPVPGSRIQQERPGSNFPGNALHKSVHSIAGKAISRIVDQTGDLI